MTSKFEVEPSLPQRNFANVIAYPTQNLVVPKSEKTPSWSPIIEPKTEDHLPTLTESDSGGDDGENFSSKKTFNCALCPYKANQSANLIRHMGYIHKAERKHQCSFCSKLFVTSGALVQHVRTHTGEKPYKCLYPNCEFSGTTSSTLKTHQQVHTKEKNYECQICHNKFTTQRSVKVHMQIHENLKPFACTLCTYRACQKANVQSHMIKFHSNERPFKCPENGCEYGAKTKYHLESHLKTHRQQKDQRCPHCTYACITPSAMRIHVRGHTGEKPFECPLCEYHCSTKSALCGHIARHTGEKNFLCKFQNCHFQAASSSILKIHQRNHTGEAPYRCTMCDYCGKQASNLKTHIRSTHTAELDGRYQCNFENCGYATKNKHNLIVHVRIHSGEKPFACPHCPYRTKYSSVLKTHQVVHTGERKFKCEECPYVGGTKQTLSAHVRTHLPEKPYKCRHCEFRACQKPNLKKHEESHGPGRKNFLQTHDDNFLGNENGGKSIKVGSRVVQNFRCKICGLGTDNGMELIFHYEEKHERPIVLLERI